MCILKYYMYFCHKGGTMAKQHKINFIFLILPLFLLIQSAISAMAAQSSADAVTDDKTKEELRNQFIKPETFPGEELNYLIGFGDILSVNIYGEGNMAATSSPQSGGTQEGGVTGQEAHGQPTTGVPVRMDGRVSLLHIGEVKVVGMTLPQSADYLKKLYSTVYANPMVTVNLLQSNSRRYTIMGEVRAPGVMSIEYPITVVQSIARSGGFTEWANHEITIVRAGDGIKTKIDKSQKNTFKFDYDDLIKGSNLEQNIYIQSGDIIVVH